MRNQLTINEYTFTAIVLTLTTTLKKLLQGPKFAIRALTLKKLINFNFMSIFISQYTLPGPPSVASQVNA